MDAILTGIWNVTASLQMFMKTTRQVSLIVYNNTIGVIFVLVVTFYNFKVWSSMQYKWNNLETNEGHNKEENIYDM